MKSKSLFDKWDSAARFTSEVSVRPFHENFAVRVKWASDSLLHA